MHYVTFKLSFEELDEPPRWLMEIAEGGKIDFTDKNPRRGCAKGVLIGGIYSLNGNTRRFYQPRLAGTGCAATFRSRFGSSFCSPCC